MNKTENLTIFLIHMKNLKRHFFMKLREYIKSGITTLKMST